tara:strand:- start:664 stop:1110 length:447 start_codon:yes stop_codon:yes gene_type:complete
MYFDGKVIDSSWNTPATSLGCKSDGFFKAIDTILVNESTGLFKSNTYEYSLDQVKQIGVIDEENEVNKKLLGTAAGAGIGALVLGPIGLVAGALASGNKKSKIVKVGVKFEDDNWLIIEFDTKRFNARTGLDILKSIQLPNKKKEAPF